MKSLVSSVVFFFFFYVYSHAQTSVFFKMYNKGMTGFAVREVNGNNYAVSGGTNYYYNYHFMIMSPVLTTNTHFFKTDVDGNLIWEKIYSSATSRTLSTWMENLNTGGYILTGHTNSDVTWPPDSNNIFLIKTDNNGILQWSKYYDTGKDELGFCVRPCFDNGFIISGFHDSVPVSLMGNTYALLIKTDSAGNVTWSKKYQIPVRDLDTGEGLPCVVKQTADSGFVVVGTTNGAHAADIFVFRTDVLGNLIWAKSYEHDITSSRFSLGLDVIETSSGDFIVAGSLDKDRMLNQRNYPCALKLNSSGALLVSTFYDSNPVQFFQSGFSSIEEIPGNGFFITGMGGYGGFGSQVELLKTDNNLNMQWSRVYTMDGNATMGARCARHTTDGGFVFSGQRQNTGTVLMKTDATGLEPCKNPGVLLPLVPSFNVVSRFPAVSTGILAFPFPLNTQVVLVDTSVVCPVILTTLPVELISLTAKQINTNEIKIEWATLSEINNDYFEIERSFNGMDFIKIGLIRGAGTSDKLIYYAFLDQNPVPGIVHYYRVRQIDYNADFKISQTVAVRFSNQGYAMPVIQSDYIQHQITFSFNPENKDAVHVCINDLTGRCIGYFETMTSQINFNMGNSTHGLYFITFSGKNLNTTVKVLY